MTKWTPGPLEVHEVDYLCESIPTTFEVSNPNEKFWACHTLTRADAHLFAAAPDLYAALEALLIDADAKLTVFREDYGLLNSREAHAAIDQARSALAKARGEA